MKFQIEKAIEILSQTPVTVKSLLGNLSDDWVTNAVNSENWSPFDIVGHLFTVKKPIGFREPKLFLPKAKI